jgi:hypothetical protein
LSALREAAQECEGCRLYLEATQTVFGEGPKGARVVLVGEQPGDAEDRAGRPFVGPAGKLLDKALRLVARLLGGDWKGTLSGGRVVGMRVARTRGMATGKKSSGKKKSGSRRYGKKAGKKVQRSMREMESGKLRSGRSGKKVTNRKQAIAIGLSEARREGAKVPSRKKSSKKSKGRKKSGSRWQVQARARASS